MFRKRDRDRLKATTVRSITNGGKVAFDSADVGKCKAAISKHATKIWELQTDRKNMSDTLEHLRQAIEQRCGGMLAYFGKILFDVGQGIAGLRKRADAHDEKFKNHGVTLWKTKKGLGEAFKKLKFHEQHINQMIAFDSKVLDFIGEIKAETTKSLDRADDDVTRMREEIIRTNRRLDALASHLGIALEERQGAGLRYKVVIDRGLDVDPVDEESLT